MPQRALDTIIHGDNDNDKQDQTLQSASRAISKKPCTWEGRLHLGGLAGVPVHAPCCRAMTGDVWGFEKTGNGLLCDPNKMLTSCHETIFDFCSETLFTFFCCYYSRLYLRDTEFSQENKNVF